MRVKTNNEQIVRMKRESKLTKDIGQRIKQLRGKQSQATVAKQIGTTLRAYQYYESGDRMPPIQTVANLASVFNTSIDWIVNGQTVLSDRERSTEQAYRLINLDQLLEKMEQSINREDRLLWKYGKDIPLSQKEEFYQSKEFLCELRSLLKNYYGDLYAEQGGIDRQPAEDTSLTDIKLWLDHFWLRATPDEKTWFKVHFLKCFPEYQEWLQDQLQIKDDK